MKRHLLFGVLAFAFGFAGLQTIDWAEAKPAKTKKAPKKPAPEVPFDEDAPDAVSETDAGLVEVTEAKEVRIQISSTAPATVYYGKKNLGRTPLDFMWPKDSGPLDLAVKANGYFTVYTRAYTFKDEKFTVKMTPLSQANTLFGYRAKLDAGVENSGTNSNSEE